MWCSCYGEKVLGKACDISIQNREVDQPFRENSRLLANLMGIFLHIRKGSGMALISIKNIEEENE